MPLRPLADVLADLDRATEAGQIPRDVAGSRSSWAEANANPDGLVDFPDSWLTYGTSQDDSASQRATVTRPVPQARPVSVDAPGEGIASFLVFTGWAVIILGTVGAFLELATLAAALTTFVSSVVGGALLIAAGTAIQLLRRIATTG